ncbi:MAG TPA: hypothetical protein VNA89_14610 [Gemmatimonadaceae bacterium]|nr:hypothetical protein [Gemmatimonadaceae bacterium]
MIDEINRPLRVAGAIATRAGDPDRGPLIRMSAADARSRLLVDGELAWLYGPRRHELAPIRVDDTLPRGEVVVRDIVSAAPADFVRIIKPDLDTTSRRRHFA